MKYLVVRNYRLDTFNKIGGQQVVYTVFDIETSGLERDSDIYEFAYIRLDDEFNIIKSDVLYFYRSKWNITAGDIHGLTKDVLEPHAKDFFKNLAAMYSTLQNTIAVGKNNMLFDNIVISNFINRYKFDVDKQKGIRDFTIKASIDVQNYMAPYYRKYMSENGIPTNGHSKGTLEDYMKVCGFTKDILENFAIANNIEVDERFRAHGAVYDTLMTFATLKWLAYSARVTFNPK